MEALGWVFLVAGLGISLVAGLWIVVLAFKESIAWGFGSLCCSIVSLVFIVMHWDETMKPFLISLLGTGLYICGVMMLGNSPQDPFGMVEQQAGFETGGYEEGYEPPPLEESAGDDYESPLLWGDEPGSAPPGGQAPGSVGDTLPQDGASGEASSPTDFLDSDLPSVDVPTSPPSTETRSRPRVTPNQGTQISLAQASRYVGSEIRVVQRNGDVIRRITLMEVTPRGLKVRERLGGGAMAFTIRESEIAEVWVVP